MLVNLEEITYPHFILITVAKITFKLNKYADVEVSKEIAQGSTEKWQKKTQKNMRNKKLLKEKDDIRAKKEVK